MCRNKRGKPIIIDPGLYSDNKSEIWWVIKQRSLPTAFKLYTGNYYYFSFSFFCINFSFYLSHISVADKNLGVVLAFKQTPHVRFSKLCPTQNMPKVHIPPLAFTHIHLDIYTLSLSLKL